MFNYLRCLPGGHHITIESPGKIEYDITIKDNVIVQVEYRSYPHNEKDITQQTITTYSEFNKSKSLDIDSVIADMKKQAVE